MLKNKLRSLVIEQGSDRGSNFEVINDANAQHILGGESTCNALLTCGTFSGTCGELLDCKTYNCSTFSEFISR